MQQRLNLKRHIAIIRHDKRRVEALAVERDAVQEAEGVRPQRLGLGVEALGRQAEVELDAVAVTGALAGRLAQELPPRAARKSMLRKLRGSFVVRRRAEDLRPERHISKSPSCSISNDVPERLGECHP